MVLEKIVSIRYAIKHPWWMFFIGGFVSLISLFLSFLIFPDSVGLFTTFLITMAMLPFMVNLLTREEITTEWEIAKKLKQNFFQRHSDVLWVYIAFFGGMILSLSLVFIFLPEETVNKLFESQINEIKLIRGSFLLSNTFIRIITNNIGVLFLITLFSFIYGAGAVFILAWNASVLSTAIGLTAKSIGGISGIPVALATYFPHGVFELLAYFLGGIAGGIISAAVMRRKTKLFGVVMKDSLKVIAVAVFFLLIGAIVETFIISSA